MTNVITKNKITTLGINKTCAYEEIIASYKLDNRFIEDNILNNPERVSVGIISPVIEIYCDGVSITLTQDCKMNKIKSWKYFPNTQTIQIFGL